MPKPSSDSTDRAVWRVGALYITHGLPLGFALIAMPAVMRQAGFSLSWLGAVGMVMLPWALKFLWAAPMDTHINRYPLRQQRAIVGFQGLAALCLMVLSFLPLTSVHETHAWLCLGLLLLANTACATADIAIDAYAVQRLPHLAGRINGWQIGGFSLGMLIGGSGVLMSLEALGWQPALLACAAALVLLTLPVLRPFAGGAGPSPDSAAGLRHLIKRPGAWAMLAVAALFKFGSTAGGSLTQAFWIDRGWSLAEVGQLSTVIHMGLGMLGACLGALLVGLFGAARCAVLGMLGSVLAIGAWAWASHGPQEAVIAIQAVEALAMSVAYVAFFALFMRWASPQQPGTDFTTLQCVESLSNIAGMGLAGFVAHQGGYQLALVAAFVLGLLAWLSVARWLLPRSEGRPASVLGELAA